MPRKKSRLKPQIDKITSKGDVFVQVVVGNIAIGFAIPAELAVQEAKWLEEELLKNEVKQDKHFSGFNV